MSYKPIENEIFHVHTYRCRHAGEEQDYEYIEAAIEIGADRIVFTDHAPFPGNSFRNRMDMKQLEEYVKSINSLKEKYSDKIEVFIGLEIEYLPGYLYYYQWLKESGKFDLLIMGQHFSEDEPGVYSFSKSKEELERSGAVNCGKAIVEGIKTGLFDVVAHPDRIFQREKIWTHKMAEISNEIIEAAREYGVLLEQNESSKNRKNQYWNEFWELVPSENMIIRGYDAHSTKEIRRINYKIEMNKRKKY